MGFDVAEYSRKRKEDEKEKGGIATNEEVGGFDVVEYSKKREAPSVISDFQSRYQGYLSSANDLIRGYQSRYYDENGNKLSNLYKSDYADYYESTRKSKISLAQEKQKLLDAIDTYGEYFDFGDYSIDDIRANIENAYTDSASIYLFARQQYNSFSDFKNEEEYYKAVDEYLALKNYDFDIKGSQLEDMTELYNTTADIKDFVTKDNLLYDAGYRSLEELKAAMDTLQTEYNYAYVWKNTMRLDPSSELYDPEFAKLAEDYDKEYTSSPSASPFSGVSARVKVIASDTEEKAYYALLAQDKEDGGNRASVFKKALEGLQKAEREVYQQKKAVEYSDTLTEYPLLGLVFNTAYSASKFVGDVGDFIFNTEGEKSDPSVADYMASYIAEKNTDAYGWYGVANDVSNTVGYMLPSILLAYLTKGGSLAAGLSPAAAGTAGAIAGSGSMGLAAAGAGYQEMLDLGYDKDQARTYGILVGASEAALEYALSGIPLIGGKATEGTISKIASKVDNALGRFAVEHGGKIASLIDDYGRPIAHGSATLIGNVASEITEEEIQLWLEPFIKQAVLDIDFEAPNAEDMLYTALVTSFSTFLLGFGDTANAEIGTVNAGKQIKSEGEESVNRLASLGTTYSADTVAGQIAGKVNKDTDAYTIGRLINEVGASLSEQNVSDITNELVKRGADQSQASSIAKWMSRVVEGAKLTKRQQVALEANEVLADVLYGTIIQPNSTVWQRTQAVNQFNGRKTPMVVSRDEREAEQTPEAISRAITQRLADAEALVRGADPRRGLSEAQIAEIDKVASEIKSNIGESSKPSSAKIAKAEGKVSDTGTTFVKSTGEEVSIKKIDSIDAKNKTMKFELSNGTVVDSTDISYGDKKQAVLYESVLLMGYDADTANAIVNGYTANSPTSISDYLIGTNEAFNYGWGHISEKARGGIGYNKLTQSERDYSIKLGEDARAANDTAREAKIPQKQASVAKKKAKGGYGARLSVDKKAVTDRVKESVKALDKVAKALKLNITVADLGGNSYGFYRSSTNELVVDVNAGGNGKHTLLFTASHELVHYVRNWSPDKFTILADFLMEQYAAEGEDIDALIRAEIDKAYKATRGKHEMTFDEAYEEVVAQAMQRFLTDSNFIEHLASLQKKDANLAKRLVSKLKEILNSIRAAYKGMDTNDRASKAVKEMGEAIEELYAKMEEGLIAASEASQSIGARNLEDFSEAKNTNGEYLFQYKAMEADEEAYRQMLKKHGIMSEQDINKLFSTIDKALAIIKNNLEVLDYAWEADIDDRSFSPVKPNSDNLYKVSLDFSTLCRKRILQQVIQTQLQDALNKPLSREESIAIRDELMKIQEEGRQIEIACALCYVESARMKSPAQIKKFLKNREAVIKEFLASKSGGDIKQKIKQAEADARERLHKENPNGIKGKDGTMLDPRNAALKVMPKKYAEEIRLAKRTAKESYKPTAEEQKLINAASSMSVTDFTSPEGLENLAKNYPVLFDAYTSFVRNATKSKGIEKDTWWRAGDSNSIGDTLIANMNRENGLRSQSWSDFQVIHLLDYIAATIELSTRNAKEQAYSKVPDYIALMGNTGVMLNMSLIPTAQFNGKLEYDSVEGMAYKKALELREKYHATAGTICIGISNDQIKMLLDDSTIDYVIPYHKSGMAAHIRKLMHIPTWSEYEDYQSEKDLSRDEAVKQAKKYGVTLLSESDTNYHKHTSFSEWFDIEEARQIAKQENAFPTDAKLQKKYGVMYGGYMAMKSATDNYLKLCAERGIAPKFSHENANFSTEANYWKLLIDRKMVDNVTGEIIEQQAIKPIFDEGEILRILNDELERYPNIKADQDYATRTVVEKFLSGKMNDRLDPDTVAAIMQKPVDNITATNILSSATEIKEFDSSKEKIESNIQDVAKMSSVYDVDKSKLEKTGKRPSDIFEEHFKEWGNRLHSDELGDITAERSSVKSEIRHGITAEKIASIEAIPSVIKEGKVIFVGQKSESGLQRIVVCAPIKIGGSPYYMGVMLQRDVKTQRLYLHNVAIEKEASEVSQDDLLTTGSHEDNEHLFVTSILQNALSVKYRNNIQELDDAKHQYVDSDTSYAPTFYSQMGKVVEGVKQEKLAANSVVNMLRGKGVKAEEIRWSGIVPFLEGKKSVTKQELLDFINGSMLQIDEETLDNKDRPYTDDQQKRLDEYESKRDEVAKKLAAEWKKITGDEFPIHNAGAGLESSVTSKIIDANLEYKNASFEGRLLKKLREDLKEVIANNDDFGFDSWKDALRSIHRHRRDFINGLDITTKDKAVIVKYCNALNAYNELPNRITDADTDRLRAIAREADPWNRKIMEVRHEHNEYEAKYMTNWGQYRLEGGKNYREILFRIPNSDYTNESMMTHWKERKGVLVHARIQDFDVNGKKMLFVEEIQSDWHNAGHKDGYRDPMVEDKYTLTKKMEKFREEFFESSTAKMFEERISTVGYEGAGVSMMLNFLLDETDHTLDVLSRKGVSFTDSEKSEIEKYVREYAELYKQWENAPSDLTAPDAPFKDTYHEYVMKRLLREAAENGYDSIGWTTAETQDERWKNNLPHEEGTGKSGFLKGYRIEYDQDIPKFLKKYGKQWGASVGSTNLPNGTEVWSMDITDSMKDSVLHEGQVMYQYKDEDAIDNRTLLAKSLEGAAKTDIEKQKLKEYQSKIDLINSEEKKLLELRSQIKKISFSKGKRDTEKLKKLQFEANQAANRINVYDKQLLRLEATQPIANVLAREKEMAKKRQKQKDMQLIADYKERSKATVRELLERNQESRKKAIEGRNKTQMRHKIKGIASELDTLLRKPTAKKHIKEELRAEVADALLAINMDTVGADERVARYNEMIAKAKDPDIIAELTKSRDNIQLQGDNLKEKLATLQKSYEKIKASDDVELSMSYQEVIRNSIANVSEKVGNTSIRNMSLEQLEMVYDLFSMIRTTIRNANKAFNEQKGQTIMQMAEAVNDQVRTVGGQRYKRNAIVAALQREGWQLLKPFVAFRTIGSVTLTNLYKKLRAGEDTFYGDVKEAQSFIEEQYEKCDYKSWDLKKTKSFKAKSGKTFDLTLEQMMTLYAYSKREQAHKHIIEGGIVFEDAMLVEKNKLGVPIKYEVTTKDAFNLSEETFAEIGNSLSAEQRAFVDAMQEYLSITMGAKGNEVSMELLGVKLFKEEFYLPIKSSQYYRDFSAEEAGEVKLKSPAFSKETVPHANNPIVIHNFTDLWAEHINDMSMYHSFVLALEDFTRVYNYKTKTDDKVETMDTKATLETAYPGSTKYINKFLKDMNGGVRSETVGWAEKLTSLAKKGSVLGSLSVMIQQPSAVMRAMAIVNPIHFAATTAKSFNLLKHKQDWAEFKKYAPIAGIKEMGRFDVGMGQGTVDWIKSNKTLMNKGEDFLSAGPAFMDEITWVSIWNAVKRETATTNKGLDPKSDEFLKIAGERVTDVISLSQVYDSVFARSDIMRNKSWIAKASTAFMAEPMTTLNMAIDAFVQGKRTETVKGFMKTAVPTAGAIVAAYVLNSALKSFVTAARDDDEDESYWEKYLEHFVGDLKDSLNPLTLVPIAKDIVSIFQGYDVERMDMALVSDLYKAIEAFDSDSKTAYEKWSGLIGATSAFFGIPVKNVERDVRAVINAFFGERESATKQGLLDAISEGLTGETESNGQQLYEAILGGDAEHIERISGRFKNQDAIDTALRKALRENDPRIKEAAKELFNGNISGFGDYIETIASEGHFEAEMVEAAIRAEKGYFEGKIKEAYEADKNGDKEAYKKTVRELRDSYKGIYSQDDIVKMIKNYVPDKDESSDDEEETTIWKASDIEAAFENGNDSDALEVIGDLVEVKTKNYIAEGEKKKEAEKKAKASVRSSVTSYWKPLYLAAYQSKDSEEMKRIRKVLKSTDLYDNVVETCQDWVKQSKKSK